MAVRRRLPVSGVGGLVGQPFAWSRPRRRRGARPLRREIHRACLWSCASATALTRNHAGPAVETAPARSPESAGAMHERARPRRSRWGTLTHRVSSPCAVGQRRCCPTTAAGARSMTAERFSLNLTVSSTFRIVVESLPSCVLINSTRRRRRSPHSLPPAAREARVHGLSSMGNATGEPGPYPARTPTGSDPHEDSTPERREREGSSFSPRRSCGSSKHRILAASRHRS